MDTVRILILGGTTEARELAACLAGLPDCNVVLSLAGRTGNPLPQPVPIRTGGFGGVAGLAGYLDEQAIDLVVDATHPFAAQISKNGKAACRIAAIPLLRLERAGWQAQEGDRWLHVSGIADAVAALGTTPRRVFLAIGRQQVFQFDAAPQHHYLVRSIDPVEPKLRAPSVDYILARGPFTVEEEVALLDRHRIDVIVSKNSGADATYAKIIAARRLSLPVVMVDQVSPDDVTTAWSVAAMVDLVVHFVSAARNRGV